MDNQIIYSPEDFFAARSRQILSAYNNVEAHVQAPQPAVTDALEGGGTPTSEQADVQSLDTQAQTQTIPDPTDLAAMVPTNVAKSEDVEEEKNNEKIEKSESLFGHLNSSNEEALNDLTKGDSFDIGAERTFVGYDFQYTEAGWKAK